jgi:hypothetical protein
MREKSEASYETYETDNLLAEKQISGNDSPQGCKESEKRASVLRNFNLKGVQYYVNLSRWDV